MDLSLELLSGHKRGLSLVNPVMTASGTFGNGLEYAKLIDIQRLGAIVSKAITLKPRRGNVQPRIVETAGGMINSIGLQNIGIEAILQGCRAYLEHLARPRHRQRRRRKHWRLCRARAKA